MKRLWIVLLLLCPIAAPMNAQSADERELKSIAQSLLDAVASGDTMAWERNLHRDFVLTDEEGRLVTRDTLLQHFRALPPSATNRLRLGPAVVRRVGNVAILSHRDLESEEIFGQKIHAEYQTTDTYVKVGGRWKLVASHVMALAQPRKPVLVSETTLHEVEGVYALAPDVTYTVKVEEGTLVGQRAGHDPEKLLPAATDIFFREGSVRGEKLFTRDANGKIIALVDRRDNIDVIWKRVR